MCGGFGAGKLGTPCRLRCEGMCGVDGWLELLNGDLETENIRARNFRDRDRGLLLALLSAFW